MATFTASNARSDATWKCEIINPTTGRPCNISFERLYDLVRHEDLIHKTRKRKVRCTVCAEEKTFSRADALTRHMRVMHPEINWKGVSEGYGSVLFFCDTSFSSCAVLTLSFSNVIHSAPTQGTKQSTNVMTESLIDHVDRPRKRHACDTCPESFLRQVQLEAHKLSHTEKNADATATSRGKSPKTFGIDSFQKTVEPHVCKVCGKSYCLTHFTHYTHFGYVQDQTNLDRNSKSLVCFRYI
jgi:hypothetical protein